MLITELKSLDKINKYNVDILMIPTIFSATSDFFVRIEDLQLFKDRKIALKLDKIIIEDELKELELFIKNTLNYDVSFYIFTDLCVYNILKKYHIEKKAVYFSKTINCSTFDIKHYNDLNIKCLVSTELPLEDLIKISDLENNFIYTYGYFNIFYSKRKLLSLYKQYANLDYNPKNKKYTLLEETREEHYPVLENNNGTFVYSSYIYLLFSEINKLNKNNYFYIDSNFIEEKDLIKIINIYNTCFDKNDFSESELVTNINKNTGTSFLYVKPEILKENK